MPKISFVYFDVGGVAIKDFSDSPKWDIMLKHMGLDQFDRKLVDDIYNSYENEIVLGKRHVDTLLPIYTINFGITFPSGFSMQEYFLSHFEPNPGLFDIFVNKRWKLGLLTDQYPGLLDGIFSYDLLPKLKWDAIIDSSVLGVRKPMPEIYQLAQERSGFPAEEILFIDNRQKNLDGAKLAGWQTYLYDSSNYDLANLDLAKFLSL